MTKLLMVLVALASLCAGEAQAVPITYSAALLGAAENPPNASPGTGSATVEYDPVAHTLLVDIAFSGLLGNTTAAHIHCCVDPPANVGVATPTPSFPGFPAGVTAGLYSQLFDLTLASSFNTAFITANGSVAGAEAALAAGLADGRAYVNIHTSLFGGGEIRGFLDAPEPATLSLLGLGAVALVRGRRKARGGFRSR